MIFFWVIVAAVVLAMLAAAWRYDRRHRSSATDVTGNAVRLQRDSVGEVQQYVPPRSLPPIG